LCCTGGTRWNENKFSVTNKWRNKESYGNPEKDVTKEELIVEMSKIYEVSEKVITEAVEPVIANYHILIKKDE